SHNLGTFVHMVNTLTTGVTHFASAGHLLPQSKGRVCNRLRDHTFLGLNTLLSAQQQVKVTQKLFNMYGPKPELCDGVKCAALLRPRCGPKEDESVLNFGGQ